MKVVKVKKDKRLDNKIDRSLGIQTYGEKNDYPQSVMEIISASVTGKSCLDVYRKFINGKGFQDEDLYGKILNSKGETSDIILSKISDDYSSFGGFALHLNYNLNYKISEIQVIPFETLRFEELNDDGNFSHVLYHPDWGKRNEKIKKFNKDDIQRFSLFDPLKVKEQINEVGIENYKGQVFYFSNKGVKQYPLPIFDPSLTDMSAEEGLSNVTYRNIRNNFFPAGMLVEIAEKDQTEQQAEATAENIKELQGDEKAGRMFYVQVADKESVPEFIPFDVKNYDKEFTASKESIKDNIGRCFSQPPILRSEDVAGNLGAELIHNAYRFYNSITSNERMNIELVMAEVLSFWFEPLNVSTEIIPLSFNVELSLAERLGDNFDKFMEIYGSENPKKAIVLSKLFGISENEINEIL